MIIEKAKMLAEVAKMAFDVYNTFADRAEKRKADEKERRIKELEAEVGELEEENARLKLEVCKALCSDAPAVIRGVEAEREACARLADDGAFGDVAAADIAAAIRARSTP